MLCELVRSKETCYVCGVIHTLAHQKLIRALESVEGVQILTSGKNQKKNAWQYHNFRSFRGKPVRTLSNQRSTAVVACFLIGLNRDNTILWCYSGTLAPVADPSHLIGSATIVHGISALPWAQEYKRLYKMSRD
jgi:hypothetical protein